MTRRTLCPLLAALLLLAGVASAAAQDLRTLVVLYIIRREALFYSGQTGTWTAVRLDSGEQVLRSAADGAVAVVVTNHRAIGFSAFLGQVDEVSVPQEEGVEAFQVAGEVASVLTRRRALGFSARAGRWAEVQRFQLGATP